MKNVILTKRKIIIALVVLLPAFVIIRLSLRSNSNETVAKYKATTEATEIVPRHVQTERASEPLTIASRVPATASSTTNLFESKTEPYPAETAFVPLHRPEQEIHIVPSKADILPATETEKFNSRSHPTSFKGVHNGGYKKGQSSEDVINNVLSESPAFDFGEREPSHSANEFGTEDFVAEKTPNVQRSFAAEQQTDLPPKHTRPRQQSSLEAETFGMDINTIADIKSDDEVFAVKDLIQKTVLTEPLPAQPTNNIQGTTDYILADQPKVGERFKSETPVFDPCACQVTACLDDFSPDPIHPNHPYDPYLNQQVYQGKQLNANQRPLLELGQPWYQLGQLSPGYSFLGQHNNVNPQLLIFGDFRNAIASNTVNGDNVSQFAWEFNTFWSFFITGTERIVTGVTPLDNGAQNTRWLLDDDRFEFEEDFDFDFGYLEGDLGAIAGGFKGETLPFDLPFAVGLTPIFIQNGVWLNDAVEGVFLTRAARNSPRLNISNMDITFAFIYDQIDSAAFEGDNSAAKAYATFLFIEALNGYFEIDYAFLEDRDVRDRSYHNISAGFTRRYGRLLSNSVRFIANAGQDVAFGDQTADGLLLISENSLITRNPYTVIPYFNFFAGFDRPQSFAGNGQLVNTGILFESDGMTGFPTLDGRGQDTFGYGIGLNLLAQDFSQQLILETAAVFRNDDSDLAGDQYGIGMRYQLPLSNSWIFRTDAMYGFFRNDDDDLGMRMELRKKF